MGAPQAEQLDAVLERPHELVRQAEALAVVAAHVAVVDQCLQRVQGGPIPQPLVDPAVHQLQQLDGELDVPQAARPQLDLPSGVARRDVRDHPLAHRLRVGDEVLPLGARHTIGATMSTKSWPEPGRRRWVGT